MSKTRIKNMMFYGFNGRYEYEREQGQKFFFDVEWVTANDEHAINDDVNDYVDPASVYSITKGIVENHRYHMLQSLGATIGDEILKKFAIISEVTTTIRKPSVPIAGFLDCVEVEITRSRE